MKFTPNFLWAVSHLRCMYLSRAYVFYFLLQQTESSSWNCGVQSFLLSTASSYQFHKITYLVVFCYLPCFLLFTAHKIFHCSWKDPPHSPLLLLLHTVDEMTWKVLVMCWCTSTEAHYPGKAWRLPQRSKSMRRLVRKRCQLL